MRPKPVFLFAAFAVGACASGRLPEGGSVAEHEAAATENAELADAHERAAQDAPPCADIPDIYEICWTRSDTEEAHRDMAQRHRRLAAAHAEEAEALKAAEAKACVGVAQEDRDISPFLRAADITGVEMLDPSTAEDETTIPVVRVTFGNVSGLDVANLQRLIDCHLARNAALGHDVPEMDYCPLVPSGVKATVATGGQQLTVTIAADEATVGEVRGRAQKLVDRNQ